MLYSCIMDVEELGLTGNQRYNNFGFVSVEAENVTVRLKKSFGSEVGSLSVSPF